MRVGGGLEVRRMGIGILINRGGIVSIGVLGI